MQQHNIQRICCLLTATQLRRYSELLDTYRHTFGTSRVCWSPIQDFHLATPQALMNQILPFLAMSDRRHEKVIVHCSGGIGRTGHVLAAWLIAGRQFSVTEAITAVQQVGRNPYEAVIAAPFRGQNPWQVTTELKTLLYACQQFTPT
jgi:protein-tyrosine phosphatase